MWTDEHTTTLVLRVAAAVVFVASLALRRAAITILQHLEDHYTVLWFDLGLPTAESQRRAWRGGTGGWRLLRFIWSHEKDQADDQTVRRCAWAMNAALVAIAAALVLILFTGATHGWERRSLVREGNAPSGLTQARSSLDAG